MQLGGGGGGGFGYSVDLYGSTKRVGLAGVSIVERDRQFYKALSGHAKMTIPRAWSFCQYTFLPKLPSVLVVEDAAEDERCAAEKFAGLGYPQPLQGFAVLPSSQGPTPVSH